MRKIVLALVLFAFIVGCSEGIEKPEQKQQIANPASVYCEEQGGRLEIRTNPDGSQAGYCIFDDGTECEEWAYYKGECGKEEKNWDDVKPEIVPEIESAKQIPVWKDKGVAISGKYADAEIITLEDGRYRMYYSAEPEVQDFKGQVYSAISSDGISWTQEGGIRKEWATFPSVVKLPDNRYRMYFQNQGLIKSAISIDGLSWEEEGIRTNTDNNAGLKLENVAAPSVINTGDEYVMVYRGTINERYPAKVPNDNMQLLLWATSKDGLTFEKKGIALDSRNDEFQGLLDGPEFVKWDDGVIRLYFWSYRGVYHATFSSGKFSETEFDFTTAGPQNRFPENPPGDPTLINIGDSWFMYYGQHGKGIFYATLGNGAG